MLFFDETRLVGHRGRGDLKDIMAITNVGEDAVSVTPNRPV